MGDLAIRVENLSKQYRIGGPEARYKTIRESLVEAAQGPFRRLSSVLRGQSSVFSKETIWALKDISFEVKRGEVLGIIGRNGAGKTTLLKVLSRITKPTEGLAEIHGRVGSLLEVGTGFHPELTGRENIYLNGAILGMKRAEIERKFDEIVEFAEIERFLDTPVKRYSSGMYVRLAFAVAAHLEPEVLLVDEVLAVGDAGFQKKCLGKMSDVAGEGRTVLFVSHNMAAVQSLCQKGVWLEAGRMNMEGPVGSVVRAYQDRFLAEAAEADPHLTLANEAVGIMITSLRVALQEDAAPGDQALQVEVQVVLERPLRDIGLGLKLTTPQGVLVSRLAPAVTNCVASLDRGTHQVRLICPRINRHLAGGTYAVGIWLARHRVEILLDVDPAGVITLPPADQYGSGEPFELERHGIAILPLEWTID